MESIKGIVLASGEKVIRMYEATRLESPKTKGFLIATNRRVIFTGEAKSVTGISIMNREIQIEKVTGVHAFFGRGMNLGVILFAVIIALISIFLLMGYSTGSKLAGIIGFGIVAFLIYRMIKNPGNQMHMVLTADNQSQSGISVTATAVGFLGTIMNRFGGDHAHMAVNAGPAKDTERMIRELGALVLDIQAQGDLALNRWLNSKEHASTVRDSKEKFDIAGTLACEKCGTKNKEEDKFCENCGSDLRAKKERESTSGGFFE